MLLTEVEFTNEAPTDEEELWRQHYVKYGLPTNRGGAEDWRANHAGPPPADVDAFMNAKTTPREVKVAIWTLGPPPGWSQPRP